MNYYRCPNGRPKDGAQKGNRRNDEMEPTGMLLLDIDDKENMKNGRTYVDVYKAFKPHFKEYGVLHFEQSARGGAHITVQRTEGLTLKQNIRLFALRFPQFTFDFAVARLQQPCYLVPNDYVFYEIDLYYSPTPIASLPLSSSDA